MAGSRRIGILTRSLPPGEVFSLENIHAAYLKCRRRKRNTVNALRFELNQEENLVDLDRMLKDRSYRPGRSLSFVRIRERPPFWPGELRERLPVEAYLLREQAA